MAENKVACYQYDNRGGGRLYKNSNNETLR